MERRWFYSFGWQIGVGAEHQTAELRLGVIAFYAWIYRNPAEPEHNPPNAVLLFKRRVQIGYTRL